MLRGMEHENYANQISRGENYTGCGQQIRLQKRQMNLKTYQ